MDWDLRRYFPEFEGAEHKAFVGALNEETAAAIAWARTQDGLTNANSQTWSEILLAYERLSERWEHLSSYLGALSAVDTAHTGYRAHTAQFSRDRAAFTKLEVEILRALRTSPDAVFRALCDRPELAGAEFFLARLRDRASHTMRPELEGLAADLAPDGFEGWGRLYDELAGGLTFAITYPDGKREIVPMSQRWSLMADPDRVVRQAAFEGGNATWAGVQDTVASALNHIAGTRLTLNARRGIEHFLDVALFDAAISRRTLDAMLEAVHAGAAVAQRYLRLKAALWGQSTVAWYDLASPISTPNTPTQRLTWSEGTEQVRTAFARSYPDLARFFEHALGSRWIDHTPRPGKQSGAFCTSSWLIEESRVFLTFQGSHSDVSTLAHEIGHAFHSHVTRELRPLARHYPMTLAESASTFAELILADGLLQNPSIGHAERIALLSETLNDSVSFLLDIPTRFAFEKAFYERRASGELSAVELCELMSKTQLAVFGDVLDPAHTDPWFWASKLHFFITSVTFYNFPYTFGYLLSRGLLAAFQQEGPSFLPRYEAFLRATGSGQAHEIAKATLDRDLEQPEFWADAIASLGEPLDALEVALTQG